MSNRSLLFLSSLAALAACLTTGCSMFHRSAPADDWQTLAPPKAVATFFVEVRRGNKQPQVKQLPLKQSLTVQHLLKETGTLSAFDRMNIVIERSVPGQHLPLKLKVPFRASTHQVAADRDYMIHPGDRVIITEDRRSIFDRFLDEAHEMMGPLQYL